MFSGLSPKESRKLAFQFATDLGKPVPEIRKITLSAGEDCFSGFMRRHCGQQDCYSLKCSYVRKFFFRTHVLRFCIHAIHHRFANISYIRAAQDDRIVGVVDECKGQSLQNDCKGGKMCEIDRVTAFNDDFTSFILRKVHFV